MNYIPVTHHSKLFSDEIIAAAAREIIRAQGYGNVWRAETQREAEALAVAALESARAELLPRATVAAAGNPGGARMIPDDELWCYDEPHESGGNCHVTMTRRQAIEWTRKKHPFKYCGPVPDNTIFFDWVSANWAYREPTEAPSTSPE